VPNNDGTLQACPEDGRRVLEELAGVAGCELRDVARDWDGFARPPEAGPWVDFFVPF
jgi:hypothetical protein